MIDDPAPYGHLVDALIARTHLVKVSEEDLRALNPVEEPLAIAIRRHGPSRRDAERFGAASRRVTKPREYTGLGIGKTKPPRGSSL